MLNFYPSAHLFLHIKKYQLLLIFCLNLHMHIHAKMSAFLLSDFIEELGFRDFIEEF